jgi:hypothetical protein
MLTISLASLVGGGLLLLLAVAFTLAPAVLGIGSIAAIVLFMGFITLQPNNAVVLLLASTGQPARSGFYWANPFFKKRESPAFATWRVKTQINSKQGNPIEIATVIVTACKAPLRQRLMSATTPVYVNAGETPCDMANSYAYDHGKRANVAERRGRSPATLRRIGRQAGQSGVAVEEARLTHLALAEIAGVMPPPNGAIIAARQRRTRCCFNGRTLKDLSERQVVD